MQSISAAMNLRDASWIIGSVATTKHICLSHRLKETCANSPALSESNSNAHLRQSVERKSRDENQRPEGLAADGIVDQDDSSDSAIQLSSDSDGDGCMIMTGPSKSNAR